jgi:hypothetical protein
MLARRRIEKATRRKSVLARQAADNLPQTATNRRLASQQWLPRPATRLERERDSLNGRETKPSAKEVKKHD